MRVLIQRVSKASVHIDEELVGSCGFGYLLLVGFTQGDNEGIVKKMAKKVHDLRILNDEKGKMNCSLAELKGSILSISQFTLYADCKEGRRPSFTKALNATEASALYALFNRELENLGLVVEAGRFQAVMQVSLINEGPVTILLDSAELGI